MEAQTAQEVINALGAISKARFLAMDIDGIVCSGNTGSRVDGWVKKIK